MIMLHLMLVIVVEDIFHAKLIGCRRTELIRCSHTRLYGKALARSIGGFSYCVSPSREGYARADYPNQVGGGSLESQVCFGIPSSTGTKFMDRATVRCHGWCVWRTRGYPRHSFRSMSGDTVRGVTGRKVLLEKSLSTPGRRSKVLDGGGTP